MLYVSDLTLASLRRPAPRRRRLLTHLLHRGRRHQVCYFSRHRLAEQGLLTGVAVEDGCGCF